jgi:serine/threonine protein kinase/Flp pilus assembly protein TadD
LAHQPLEREQDAIDSNALVDRLAEQMADSWKKGEQTVAEEYLARYPALLHDPEAALGLIYEELYLRRQSGQAGTAANLLERFPQWREQIQILLDCLQLLETEPAAAVFPAAGESLEDFQLLAELGRGAQGRVFLATQPSLADRPVVLKLAPRFGQEHLSLARLQHTHIVPLYSVQEYRSRNLRGLCMPYFGGTTLAPLLEALVQVPPDRRTGQDLLRALRGAEQSTRVPLSTKGPACQFLARATYVEAICWIGACLAEALHYAQERRLLHLDIKPSNVLLAADGQPMLLDFHLAREAIAQGAPAPAWLGGTPSYMSPEQEQAVAAIREGRRVPVAIDGRSDIYSLGVLLCEALTGTLPFPTGSLVRWLRQRNSQVTVGLANLLGKCLARDARDRYADAAALATDLHRHLADLPLRGVGNSWAESWKKWRRRRPYALVVGSALLLSLIAGGAGVVHVRQQLSKAETALREGRDLLRQNELAAALGALKQGIALAEDLPFSHRLVQQLQQQLRLAERIEAGRELHLFVERVRVLEGTDLPPLRESQSISSHCRSFWEKRDLIIKRLALEPTPELKQQFQNDLLDLAILWTQLRERLAQVGEIDAVYQEALEVLAQAETTFGPSGVIFLERQRLAGTLGLTEIAREAARQASLHPPQTPWEHYALGRALLRAGETTLAKDQFQHALDLQPQGLWPHFYWGKCAFQLEQYEDAVSAFTACVALAPDRAWCVYNRGLAYEALGRLGEALRDYDRALDLDTRLAPAALNRGMLHYREQRYASALADLTRALDSGAKPAVIHYDRALVQLAQGDRAAALASLDLALQHDSNHSEARGLADRLQSGR